MAKLLKITGIIWASIGALNVLAMFAKLGPDAAGQLFSHTTLESFGLILNFILFVFPGLVLMALGAITEAVTNNRKAAAPAAPIAPAASILMGANTLATPVAPAPVAPATPAVRVVMRPTTSATLGYVVITVLAIAAIGGIIHWMN
jgi:hypothetical protein